MGALMAAIVTGVCLALSAICEADAKETFRLGVCCHPSYVRLMPTDWDEVFKWTKGCGADLCRIDWDADWELNDRILTAAAAAGVELLPILFPPAPQQDTEQAWYATARAYAQECGRRYRDKIRYYELSNEREARCMTQWPNGGDRDGAAITDYDPDKYAPIRGMLRGLAEGLRETDLDCRRIIDTGGWLHFGFIDMLVRDEVPFDILAWHWYSEMGEMNRVIKSYSGEYQLLDKLASYGKPVWITEGNMRHGTMAGDEKAQQEYLTKTIGSLAKTGKIGAYVAYELFDEPSLLSHGGEAFYGIVHCEFGLNEGREFAGARGTVRVREEFVGRKALVLGWDFTKGGAYVTVNWLPRKQVTADVLRLAVRGPAGSVPFVIRVVDSTGQHLQLTPDIELTGQWQEVCVPFEGPWDDTWAGDDDGTLHQPIRGVWIGVGASGPKTGEVGIARLELLDKEYPRYTYDLVDHNVFQAKPAWAGLWGALGDR